MKKIFLLLLIPLLAVNCLADEQTRQVQAALASAGFYFGIADGKMGDETRAALRRYQIRNGLDVSGNLSPETLAALKVAKSENTGPAAADEQQIASTAKAPDAFLSPKNRVAEPSQTRQPRTLSPQGQSNPTPVEVPVTRSPVREFYSDTDMATAAPAQQNVELIKAQRSLARLGFYRGAPNGLPGPEMEEALFRFQGALHLRLTGRLDNDTRQALFNAPPSVPTKPFRHANNRPNGTVLRGVWVH